MRSYSQRIFKHRFNLSQEQVNGLAKCHIIEVHQSGFKGDSMHHPKIVVVKDEIALKKFLGQPLEEQPKHKPRDTFEKRLLRLKVAWLDAMKKGIIGWHPWVIGVRRQVPVKER